MALSLPTSYIAVLETTPSASPPLSWATIAVVSGVALIVRGVPGLGSLVAILTNAAVLPDKSVTTIKKGAVLPGIKLQVYPPTPSV